jgi:hypothetical protein
VDPTEDKENTDDDRQRDEIRSPIGEDAELDR